MERFKKLLSQVLLEIIVGLVAAALLPLISFVFRKVVDDVRLVVLVSALALLSFCLYLFFSFRRNKAQGRKQGSRQKQSQKRQEVHARIHRGATVGLVVIPIVATALLGVIQYQLNRPPSKLIVLVADFDGPDPKNYRVTETIVDKLAIALEPYQDEVDVVRLGRAITSIEGREVAVSKGEKAKASIVIWGWYGSTGTTVPLNVNFELIGSAVKDVSYCGAVDEIRTYEQSDLDTLTLQTKLSDELAYLTLFTVGMTRYQVEDWGRAIQHFDNAANYSSEWIGSGPAISLHYYRGYSYLHLGDRERALADFGEVLTMNPSNAVVLNTRARIYAEQGQHQEAIADYTVAIDTQNRAAQQNHNEKSAKATAEARLGLGTSYFVYVTFESPSRTCLYNDRALSYSQIGLYDDAFSDIDQAIEMDPDDGVLYLNRGNFHYQTGDFEEAVKDYDRGIELGIDHSEIYYARGRAKSRLGSYAQALEDLDTALSRRPQLNEPTLIFGVCYQERGRIHEKLGNTENAIEDYKTALDITDDPDIRSYLMSRIRELENAE